MIRKTEKKHGGYFHFSFNPLTWLGTLIDLIVSDPEDSMKHTSEENKNEDEEPVDEEGLMKEKVKKT